jgi:hypothetical protein
MAQNTSKRSFASFAEANGTESSSKKPCADGPTLDTIRQLPIETIQDFLYNMCRNEPKIARAVQHTCDSYLAKLAAQPPVDFDHYSKSCWYTLNKKYARLRPSQQFEVTGDIIDELSDARTSMMKEAGPATRFETRRNALEVLRKISKSMMLCQEQEIRHELMNDGMLLADFAESMLELAKGMTRNERERYRVEGLHEKLIELQGECDAGDMEGLADVYAVFDED